MNIVIIEDEVLTAEDMADIIADSKEDIKVSAILLSVKEAIAYFASHPQVDLVFSDIQLGDGLSFEIFKAIKVDAPVIFCTAYDEYALEAIKSNGIEYILKPFTKETILGAINKYHQLKKHFTPVAFDYESLIQAISGHTAAINEPRSILVYYKDTVLPVAFNDVALFYIDGEVNRLLFFDGKSFIVNQSLDELERLLKGQFFRTNRQFLVNRKAVRDASSYDHRKYIVNLSVSFKEAVVVSKNRTTAFLNWLTLQ